jgi:hypothetical protein
MSHTKMEAFGWATCVPEKELLDLRRQKRERQFAKCCCRYRGLRWTSNLAFATIMEEQIKGCLDYLLLSNYKINTEE